ncbi:MAG: DUF882 domain-containing protein [Pseudomonadota bacterium]
MVTIGFLLALTVPGAAETRKLKLYFLHTGEKATITYKKDGKFIDSGLTKINKLLRDWRRDEATKMDPRLLDLIWDVYKETGSKKYIHVVSGYRSPATNSLLRKRGRGVAKKSLHTHGKALDFFIPGVKLKKLRNIGLKVGLGGVGYYPKNRSPFVHMDTGSVRHWPRMKRNELARVFPGGKTLHLPRDGKPLAKYHQAKAEYQRKVKSQGDIVVAQADEIEEEPNFFEKLLGGGAADTPAPATGDLATQSDPGVILTTPTPRPGLQEPENPEIAPEFTIAELPIDVIPIPVLAPRDTQIPAGTPVPGFETASLEQQADGELITPQSEDAFYVETADYSIPDYVWELDIPLPEKRPADYVYVPSEPVESPTDPLNEEQPVFVAALSPVEIEDLRRQVYEVINENNYPVDSSRSTTRVTSEFSNTSSTTKLSLVPSDDQSRIAETIIDRQFAALEPLEPGIKTTNVLAVPEIAPRDASSEATTEIAALQQNGLESIKTGATQSVDSGINSDTLGFSIPIPTKAKRPILVAARSEDEEFVRRLESLESISVNERLVGRWALASNASITDIAEIKRPALAHNILLELPGGEISSGFTQGLSRQTTRHFSGTFSGFSGFNTSE